MARWYRGSIVPSCVRYLDFERVEDDIRVERRTVLEYVSIQKRELKMAEVAHVLQSQRLWCTGHSDES